MKSTRIHAEFHICILKVGVSSNGKVKTRTIASIKRKYLRWKET